MRSMNDEDGSNNNMNNWLGFSLSSHMKMEAANSSSSDPHNNNNNNHHHHQHLSYNYLSYGHVAETGAADFHSPLSVMPLKSDGSLCIMEALSRSHSQVVVPSPSPKLEDFLGGATMAAAHHHLTLDNAFYNQYYNTTTTQIISETHEIPYLKTWIDNQPHAQIENQYLHTNNTNGDNLQSLSLSMSPGSQSSSCVTASRQISPTETTHTECVTVAAVEGGCKKRSSEKMGHQKQTVHRKSIDTFGQRTSQYRGVTRHRWTGRYEAHLWDNSCKKEGQTRKGRQVYLGGYDMEEKAARAYDLAALKYWGPSTHINFPLENYHQELEEMKNMSRQEYVAHLRRKSSGFSRGASIYRGVTRHHQHGRWQARIGRVAGNKDLYLGTFSTQEEAAEAYDIAAIKFRGANAVTNFDISRYDVEKIMASNTLPTGDIARRNKEDKPYNAEAAQGIETRAQVEINNVANVSDWKMVLQNQENVTMESLNAKTLNSENYQNLPFSVALHDLMGLESSQTVVNQSNTTTANVGPNFSNASLVTSLSSSREPSPDKYGAPILFAKPNASSWIPTAELRPVPSVPLATAHLPVFAAWNDV